MQTHESIQTAIDGNTVEHAKALRLSTSTLHKWQEPSTDFTDSGSLNPVDRIITIVEKAVSLGTDRRKALAPIQCQNEHFGLITIPIPRIPACNRDITAELLKTIEEFSDLTREVSEALADENISKDEARRVRKEGWDLIRKTAELIACTEAAAK